MRNRCAVRCLVGACLLALLVVSCEKKDTPVVVPPSNDDKNAELNADVKSTVAVIRLAYPIAQRASKADWDLATCIDSEVGYDTLKGCLADALQKTDAANEAFRSSQLNPTTPCAAEVYGAHSRYLTGQVQYLQAFKYWVDSSSVLLSSAMRNKSLTKACQGNRCQKRPSEFDFPGTGFATVNGVECTKKLFFCDQTDNVCHITKVADRLGVGERGARGTLLVRATGADVE